MKKVFRKRTTNPLGWGTNWNQNSGVKSLASDKLKLTRIVEIVEGRSNQQEQRQTQFIKGTLGGWSLAVRNRVPRRILEVICASVDPETDTEALHQHSSSEGNIPNNCRPWEI